MRSTVDWAERLVDPEGLRDESASPPGVEVEIRAVDGRVEIAVPATEVCLERHDGVLVVVSDRSMPTLRAEVVRRTLEQVRR